MSQKSLIQRNISFQVNDTVISFGKQVCIPKPAPLHLIPTFAVLPHCHRQSQCVLFYSRITEYSTFAYIFKVNVFCSIYVVLIRLNQI
jgi:hypothetical protein